MPIDLSQLLTWRLRRHGLSPVAGGDAADIVRRVVALRGWPADLADLAICVRQSRPEPGALGRALSSGDVIRSYAFRGGSYVFSHEVAAVLLSVRTATRVWETRRYQQQGGFALDDWEPLRDAIREALTPGPLTRQAIAAHLSRISALQHLATGATGAGADSLYKPLHWWGDICFGPDLGGQSTFRLLSSDPRWPGLPDVDEAGRRAVALYLEAYGHATLANLGYWLTEGLSAPRRRLLGWIADLGDDLTEVSVAGVRGYALSAAVDEIAATEPAGSVRLLPGFDPWVMGPGTADARIIAAERRALASSGNNLVIRDGVVSGTWRVRKPDELLVSWFSEAGPAPVAALEDEVRRVGSIRADQLSLRLELS